MKLKMFERWAVFICCMPVGRYFSECLHELLLRSTSDNYAKIIIFFKKLNLSFIKLLKSLPNFVKQFSLNLSINYLHNKVQYLSGKLACHSLSKRSIQSLPDTTRCPSPQAAFIPKAETCQGCMCCGYTLAGAQPHLWFDVSTGIKIKATGSSWAFSLSQPLRILCWIRWQTSCRVTKNKMSLCAITNIFPFKNTLTRMFTSFHIL